MVSQLIAPYLELPRRWALIRFLVQGELTAQMHRTLLGAAWYTLMPIMQIMIYYLLVVVLFQRGGAFGINPFLAITMGIMHYMMLNQAVGNALSAIHGAASLQLQIKIEPIILVAAKFYKAIRTSMFGIVIFFIVYVFIEPVYSWRLVAYPFIMLLWLWFCWAVVLFAASATVYVRDLERLVPFLVQIMMYSSPVIYSVSFYPEPILEIILLSPPALIFALFQWALLGGPAPPAIHVLASIATLSLGLVAASWFYLWSRKGFTKAF